MVNRSNHPANPGKEIERPFTEGKFSCAVTGVLMAIGLKMGRDGGAEDSRACVDAGKAFMRGEVCSPLVALCCDWLADNI